MKKAVFILFIFHSLIGSSQNHPRLILTEDGVRAIRENIGKYPLFDNYLMDVKAEVDSEINLGIRVPIPKDMAGGYTHEQHKRNFFILQKAGALYQILQDDAYANYVKEVLMEYAKMYKSLPVHPQERSYARGKLFWQCLNDSNWLVYVSQAYDCIYDFLSKKEKNYLEKELFRPFADYISIKNPQFFNRIHNHSTWGNAAVGMIGLVMNDEELIQRALYGIPNDSINEKAKDNDGGFIKSESGKVGFLANLEAPFSPDGYYTEGPYYQRYAMYPYLLFAVGLSNVLPELEIFKKKNGVLLKAVDALLNLTDTEGEFYALNDAQKGMSYFSRELVSAVDIAYYYGDKNPGLLSIAEKQGQFTLDDAGFSVAKAIEKARAKPFLKGSIEYTDGPEGNQGGITVLRHGELKNELNLVAKYTSHGNSHGHYDKLSYSLFFGGNEVLQDYGLARFVNIDQKNGGGYLKENSTWAKQTIAHNTLVIDEQSHFKGDYEKASQNHSEKHYSHLSEEGNQLISMRESQAYPGTEMLRTLVMLTDERLEHPLVLDVFKINTSDEIKQFDLPYHYFGQLMTTSYSLSSTPHLSPLGKGNGYQHLWHRASGNLKEQFNQTSWLNKGVFHTLSSVTIPTDEFLFTQLGANDPNFNLRNDSSLVLRRRAKGNTIFINALETHGKYDPVSEIPINSTTSLNNITLAFDSVDYTVIHLNFKKGSSVEVILVNKDSNKNQTHNLTIDGHSRSWNGPFLINKL